MLGGSPLISRAPSAQRAGSPREICIKNCLKTNVFRQFLVEHRRLEPQLRSNLCVRRIKKTTSLPAKNSYSAHPIKNTVSTNGYFRGYPESPSKPLHWQFQQSLKHEPRPACGRICLLTSASTFTDICRSQSHCFFHNIEFEHI